MASQIPLAWLPGFLLVLLFPTLTAAHDHSNGFDSSMDMPMSLAQGTMTAFLHFRPGDTLWFDGWVPGKSSTLFGACFGLFMLGIAERWTAALRAGVEVAIQNDLPGVGKRRKILDGGLVQKEAATAPLKDIILLRVGTAAPFIVRHAWARFILHGAQATFAVLFMLVIMTFQVAFLLSLAIGVGAGEMMYGRYTDAAQAGMQSQL